MCPRCPLNGLQRTESLEGHHVEDDGDPTLTRGMVRASGFSRPQSVSDEGYRPYVRRRFE